MIVFNLGYRVLVAGWLPAEFFGLLQRSCIDTCISPLLLVIVALGMPRTPALAALAGSLQMMRNDYKI